MSDDDGDWVIPPPEPDTVGMMVRLGEGATLSPAAVAALETLATELAGADDVSGFAVKRCPFDGCEIYLGCTSLGKCQPLEIGQCYTYSTCRITG